MIQSIFYLFQGLHSREKSWKIFFLKSLEKNKKVKSHEKSL